MFQFNRSPIQRYCSHFLMLVLKVGKLKYLNKILHETSGYGAALCGIAITYLVYYLGKCYNGEPCNADWMFRKILKRGTGALRLRTINLDKYIHIPSI